MNTTGARGLTPSSPSWSPTPTILVDEPSSPAAVPGAELAPTVPPIPGIFNKWSVYQQFPDRKEQDLIHKIKQAQGIWSPYLIKRKHLPFEGQVQFSTSTPTLNTSGEETSHSSLLLPQGQECPVTLSKARSACICEARPQHRNNHGHDLLLPQTPRSTRRSSRLHGARSRGSDCFPKCDE